MANRETLLASTFLTLADTLVDDFDVVEVLGTLCGRCVGLLGASASGILLADARGALHVMATSGEQASLLELFQIQNEEGPCLDSFRSGQAVVHDDLDGTSPWPRFAPAARRAGFHGVHAFPMVVRSNVVGTLNLFMDEPRPLLAPDVDVAQALAHAATLTVLQNRATEDSHRLTTQLQEALDSRITIEQAKGVVSELGQVGTDEAFTWLRSFARSKNRKLTDVATAVVDRTLDDRERSELLRAGSTEELLRTDGAPGPDAP